MMLCARLGRGVSKLRNASSAAPSAATPSRPATRSARRASANIEAPSVGVGSRGIAVRLVVEIEAVAPADRLEEPAARPRLPLAASARDGRQAEVRLVPARPFVIVHQGP